MPAQELRIIPVAWPFVVWGLDMVWPFKRSKDKKTHLLVAVDKFTKWVEAEPISKCDAATEVQYIKKVIFHFSFPHSIITDNGTNLSKGAMKEFCQPEHIRLDVSLVAHSQSNGQAERANKEILRGIKSRLMVPLQRTPSCWMEELPSVLWSITTTPNRSTGYTPFSMVYGAEAVLPSDIRHDLPRVAAYVEADNEKARQDALDLLDGERDLAAARAMIYQQDLRRYHNRRFKTRTFQEGDLVHRLIQDQSDMHKLSSPWEGHFVVSKNLNNGSYYPIDVRDHKDSHTSEEETHGRGILLIFGLTILEPLALVMYIF